MFYWLSYIKVNINNSVFNNNFNYSLIIFIDFVKCDPEDLLSENHHAKPSSNEMILLKNMAH